MLRIYGAFLAACLLAGCAESTSDRAVTDQTTVRGSAGQKLALATPAAVSIKRGEAEKVTLRLRRSNFHEDVKVWVSQLPAGVEAVDSPRTTSLDSVEVVLRADEKAALVKRHRALVSAEGPEGIRTTQAMEVTVRERS